MAAIYQEWQVNEHALRSRRSRVRAMIISAMSYGILQLGLRAVRVSRGTLLSGSVGGSTLTSRRRDMVVAEVDSEWFIPIGQRSESFGRTIGGAILGIGDEGRVEGPASPSVRDIVIATSVRGAEH